MLFQNIKQFQEAKKVLIESEGDTEKTFSTLKESSNFSAYSEEELKSSIIQLNEGLGDKILNFFSYVLNIIL